MHYFFLDESYPPSARGQRQIVMAAWAVERNNWSRNAADRYALYKPPVLERICSMLESLDGSALVARAILDESLYRTGEIDRTNDIPSMARSDLIWSMSATFVLGTLVLALLKHNREVATIDIYFDPKSLKSAHSETWQRMLREFVVKEAKRFALQRGFQQLKKLKMRRIEPITKPALRHESDKFQMGTWVADKLCSQFDEIEASAACPRIATLDMSEPVRRTTQQFDGKSFYDS